MRKTIMLFTFLFVVPAFVPRSHAQETAKANDAGKTSETAKAPEPPAHYYHLEFVIQELGADGKPTNSRSYSTIVNDRNDEPGDVRTGARVPIITGGRPGTTANGELDFQYQYLDVGVSIATRNVHEVDRQLAFKLKIEVSSLADSTPSTAAGMPNDPVIRQNMWQAAVVIPIGKSTVVFSSDSLNNKGAMQAVVTATPIQQ